MTRIVSFALLLIATAFASNAESLKLADGRSVGFIISEANTAKATALLLVGGKGVVSAGSKNFLLRVQPTLAEHGITSVLVDVPSDRDTLSAAFRVSATHAEDLATVISWLRVKYRLPVWVVGNSRGTISAVNLMARGRAVADGIVLSASVTKPRRGSELADAGRKGVLDHLAEFPGIPALVLHHQDDGCSVTPPKGAQALIFALAQSPRRDLVLISGGEAGSGNPCRGNSHHGFLGVEREAVSVIARFILME